MAHFVASLLALSAALFAAVARGTAEGQGTKASLKVASRAGETPVTRVVGLLKEMQTTVSNEAEEDKKLAKKMGCWCYTNKWIVTQNLESLGAKRSSLETTLSELGAKFEELESESSGAGATLEQNENSLAEATEIRTKDEEKFAEKERSLIESIESLKGAIAILSKHEGSALPQLALPQMSQQNPVSFVQVKDEGVELKMSSSADHDFDDFMSGEGANLGGGSTDSSAEQETTQQPAVAATSNVESSSAEDKPATAEDKTATQQDVDSLEMAPTAYHNFDNRMDTDDSTHPDEAESAPVADSSPQQTARRGFLASNTAAADTSNDNDASPQPAFSQQPVEASSATSDSGASATSTEAPSTQQVDLLQGWSENEINSIRRAWLLRAAYLQTQGKDTYVPEYQTQSGGVLGMMRAMKDSMTRDLKESQKAEARAIEVFRAMRASKRDEIEANKHIYAKDEEAKAKFKRDLIWARSDYSLVSEQLDADRATLKNLNDKCDEEAKNYDKRVRERSDELEAIAKTIDILTTDEALDAQAEAYAPTTFLQVASKSRSKAKFRSGSKSRRSDGRQYAQLSTEAQKDALGLVEQEIAKMITDLKKQQKQEVTKKDECEAKLQRTDMDRIKAEDDLKDYEGAVDEVVAKIEQLNEQIADEEKDIEALRKQSKEAVVDRAEEKKIYKAKMPSLQLTIDVLHKAEERLSMFYKREESLVQKRQQSLVQTDSQYTPTKAKLLDEAAPVQKTYERHQGNAGVLEMLDKLVYDLRVEMQDAATEDAAGDTTLQELIATNDQAIKDANAAIYEKTREIVSEKKEQVQAAVELDHAKLDASAFAKEIAILHKECDYIMANFEVRQKARLEEIGGLQSAEQMLSGAVFE